MVFNSKSNAVTENVGLNCLMTVRVTAVTASRCTQKVAVQPAPEPLDTLSEQGDGSAVGDGKGREGDGSGSEYVLINGKRVPVVRMSFEDIVLKNTTKLRLKIYEESGVPVPELKLGT